MAKFVAAREPWDAQTLALCTTARQTGAHGGPGAAAPPAAGLALAPESGAVTATVAPAAAGPLAPNRPKVKAARPAPPDRGQAGRAGAAATAAIPARHAHAHARAAAVPAAARVQTLVTVRTPSGDTGPTGAHGAAAARAVASALSGGRGTALGTAARALVALLTAAHAMPVRTGRTHPGRAGAPAAPRVAPASNGATDRARAAMVTARAIHQTAHPVLTMYKPTGARGLAGARAPATVALGRVFGSASAAAIARAAAR